MKTTQPYKSPVVKANDLPFGLNYAFIRHLKPDKEEEHVSRRTEIDIYQAAEATNLYL
jgi:hypothetical protein